MRIVGGTDAERFQYPWQTALVYKPLSTPERYKEHVFCGGSIISQSYILTAAHCLEGLFEDNFEVVVGEYDLSKKDGTEVRAGVAKIILHKAFTGDVAKGNDIGLIKLKEPLEFGPAVAPICLPPLAAQLEGLTPGTMGTVVGWGRIGKDDLAPHSNVLQAATVPILSDSECLAETGLANSDDQVCAGESESDISACPGDSGGALQVQDAEGRWMMVGIVSNGPSVCGLQPVVFHKIAKTIDWIDKVVERHLPNVP